MDAPLLSRALARAVLAHRDQRRKASRHPYVVHPMRVVGRLVHWGVTDVDVLAAAALHDTVEDTPLTREEVRDEFGRRVADLVDALTHEPGLPPRERTRVVLAQLDAAPLEAVLVKIADRLDNVHEMTGWRASSRLGYLGESAEFAALARRRIEAGDGDATTRDAMRRALADYNEAVAVRRAEAERDLTAGGAPRPRRRPGRGSR